MRRTRRNLKSSLNQIEAEMAQMGMEDPDASDEDDGSDDDYSDTSYESGPEASEAVDTGASPEAEN